jgi:hypothetical protein
MDATRSQLTTADAAWERAGKESPSNVRRRYLAPAAEDASATLIKAGRDPLPRLTPPSLRRSFASLLVAIGRDPLYVADQLGHVDPGFSLRRMRRSSGSGRTSAPTSRRWPAARPRRSRTSTGSRAGGGRRRLTCPLAGRSAVGAPAGIGSAGWSPVHPVQASVEALLTQQ